MRYLALILLFCVQALAAQVAAPQLRCSEVLPNGDVLLNWQAPADQGGNFLYYEIFWSTSANGPFTAVTPTIGTITTQTAIHSGTTALAQTVYYYISAVSNNQMAASSNTIQTIFLNVFPGDPALQLTYNNIQNPPPPGTSGTFTITREFPAGTISQVTVTSLNRHFEVISVCEEKINFQVELANQNGCVSKSNIIYGTYSDTKTPDTTYIDSISVLPDGRTILAWQVASDFDVDTYFLVKKGPTKYDSLDVMSGRHHTSYIYDSTEANYKPVSIFVRAIDSCFNKAGPFDERPVTMFLQPEYDQCRYLTRLNWNAYQGMRKGIKEYRIYYSEEGSPYTVIGTTQETGFVHENVQPGKNISYFVRVVNGDQSITASSNRSKLFTREVQIPSFLYLSNASVNREQNVEVTFYVETGRDFSTLEVQRRESLQEDFQTVGTMPYDALQYYTFVDEEAETARTPYYYRALLRDSCNNIRSSSNIARSIHLRVNSVNNDHFRRKLSWTPYEGFAGGIQQYRIKRIVNGELDPQAIAGTPSATMEYTDNLEEVAAEGSDIAYMVEAVESPVSPYPFTAVAGSNIYAVYVEGRMYVPNAFSPRGINNTWKPVTHFVSHDEYNLKIFDRWGAKIFESNNTEEGWDGANKPAGVYVYLITYRNARGEFREQKGTILLLQ